MNSDSERLRARDGGGYIQTGPDEEPPVPDEGVAVCPLCETKCWREEADVGVGVLFGPWGCPACGWSEDPQYDQTLPAHQPRTDQYGGLYPA